MHANYPIGVPDDAHIRDGVLQPETYCETMENLAGIRQVQPKARTFVLTNPLQAVEDADTTPPFGQSQSNSTTSISSTCTDTARTSTLPASWKSRSRGGHYNAIGYYICACVIATYIDWIVKKYPEEFREVEFIGTDDAYDWTAKS